MSESTAEKFGNLVYGDLFQFFKTDGVCEADGEGGYFEHTEDAIYWCPPIVDESLHPGRDVTFLGTSRGIG